VVVRCIVGAANGSESAPAPTVPVAVLREINHIKIAVEEIVVGCLLIFSFVIHEPYAIQTVHTAVVAYTEGAADICTPPGRFLTGVREPDHRLRRDRDGPL